MQSYFDSPTIVCYNYIMTRKGGNSTRSSGLPPTELASIFEEMMQQLTLLGHTLPKSAVSFTPQQLKILFTLDFFGEPIPMSKLSSRLGVTPGTLTRTAAGLLRRGYLERRRSSEDERIVKISLSKAGRRVVSQIKKYRQDFFGELCKNLSIADRRKLVESHRYILETYRHILKEKNRSTS
jgi:DNA-binding MarR family transcriptional regulator